MLFAAVSWSFLAALPAAAAVNDVFPTDYAAANPGTWNLSTYAYDRGQEGPYKAGNPVGGVKLHSRIGALRLSRSSEVAGMTVAPMVALSGVVAHANQPLAPSFQRRGSGFGDFRFGATAWLVNDRPNRRWIGLTGSALVPTGTYNPRNSFNAGENRWRWVAMAGWVEGIGERLTIDLSQELAWYGRNDHYIGNNKLTQDMTWAVTGYLRWKAEDNLQLFTGGQINGGGVTRVNGVRQNNPAEYSRLYLGGIYSVDTKTHLNLRFGRDLAFENGLKTRHELTLRLITLFGGD